MFKMNVDDAVICRLKKGGLNFEILVDCDKAMEFKHGKGEIEEIILSDDIFKDVKKGEHASEHDLRNVFSTDDKKIIIDKILYFIFAVCKLRFQFYTGSSRSVNHY